MAIEWIEAPKGTTVTNTHNARAAFLDLRTELCDLRSRYLRSGWVDSGMEEGFDNLIDRLEQLENGETSTEATVRRIVSECIWHDPQAHDAERNAKQERDAVGRLMRLIRHREGR